VPRYETLTLEARGDAVWITLNRPAAANAVDFRMMRELPRAIEIALDAEPAALVVTGAGRAFCAGGDLRELAARVGPDGLDADELETFFGLTAAFERLLTAPTVVVAAVNGVCVAGGLELLLVSDLALAAASARFGDGHVNNGLIPAGGSTVLLPRVVGLPNARRLLYTGELVDARRAYELGLVQWLVEDENLVAATDHLVETLAARPRAALAELKRLSALAFPDAAPAMAEERRAFAAHLATPEAQTGLRAFAERSRGS
jgi:enoyl-CoA hydratase/carnithine racemase